ncbi:MAG TPA: glycoside hydrolase domain-containing protein [Pseudolabrys sp.]|nr:glycoside hydrolase domain-containing protein [Pseudolabrys sp.]
MSVVSRRTFTTGLLASALVPGRSAIGQPNDPASIAIIDTPNNAAKFASKLSAQNVKVVVRFFARKPQPGLREKVMASNGNMIDGVREPAILIRNGLSIVSLYQYRNNLPEKFLKGLEDTGSARAEAAADAKAALDQAGLVGQPEGSAVYFGVDFNVTRNSSGLDAVLEYFRFMNQTVGSRYAIGIYGNGLVNRTLREEKLVSYNWISASRSHEETVAFYNSGQWHLFQNQVDRRWFGPPGKCATGLDVDTNIQNPGVSGIGAWGAGEVDESRNRKIFDQRRFAIRPTPVVAENGGGSGDRHGCKPDHRVARNANVRVLAQSGAWSGVDVNEDGIADGQVRTTDLTSDLATMPPWGSSS